MCVCARTRATMVLIRVTLLFRAVRRVRLDPQSVDRNRVTRAGFVPKWVAHGQSAIVAPGVA